LKRSSGRNSGSRADDIGLRSWRRRFQEYDEITNFGPIIRRYFVIGAFDGAAIVVTFSILFIMGVYLGNLVRERALLTGLRFVAAGIGTAVVLWLLGERLL
jgi:hypothetical protein